ncbi:MAG TPA: DUF167 domain-containing protein [Thermoleophilia bacterium]|jgi:uncharacterized protein (TIGR00251 family)
MVDSPQGDLTIRQGSSGLLVGVRVSPGSRRTVVRGIYGERLKIAVSAPPEDDRANRELVGAVAGWLGLSRENVTIVAGHVSKDKTLAFKGIEESELRSRLATLAQEHGG